ncbi:hypothetical protein OROGR_000614 [Orobanche gracilis]
MTIYSSDSDDHRPAAMSPKSFLGTEKPLHDILGGGKAADILLWRNDKLSAGILIGLTIIWFLFEFGEYNFISLACHVSIITMLILFLWSSGAGLVAWNQPDPKAMTIPESTFRWLFSEINKMLLKFYHVSSGKDSKAFFLAIAFLWMLSGIGNCLSPLSLLYIGFLGLMTLPASYERYRNEVDSLANKGDRYVKKVYKKIDSKILNKIPRGPKRF